MSSICVHKRQIPLSDSNQYPTKMVKFIRAGYYIPYIQIGIQPKVSGLQELHSADYKSDKYKINIFQQDDQI